MEFFSYWHTGSGLSAGAEANLEVIKNEHNLPYIPGRTLKGLLRDAAERIHALNNSMVSRAFIESVFGLGQDSVGQDQQGQREIQSACFFSNAELSPWLTSHLTPQLSAQLYEVLASTAIDERGLAKDQTLRQMEVIIPLTLYAAIEYFPDSDANRKQLSYCFQWIKRMGANRTRGLGNCQFTFFQPTEL